MVSRWKYLSDAQLRWSKSCTRNRIVPVHRYQLSYHFPSFDVMLNDKGCPGQATILKLFVPLIPDAVGKMLEQGCVQICISLITDPTNTPLWYSLTIIAITPTSVCVGVTRMSPSVNCHCRRRWNRTVHIITRRKHNIGVGSGTGSDKCISDRITICFKRSVVVVKCLSDTQNEIGIFEKIGDELWGAATLFKVASTYKAGTPVQLGVYKIK